MNAETEARQLWCAEREDGRAAGVDGAVEEVLDRGKNLRTRAKEARPVECVRGVHIETEVAVQQVKVPVIIVLAPAGAAVPASAG